MYIRTTYGVCAIIVNLSSKYAINTIKYLIIYTFYLHVSLPIFCRIITFGFLTVLETYLLCTISKWVWSGNTTITHCRPTHGNVRKSHKTFIVTIHLWDNNSKATSFLFHFKMIAKLERTQSQTQKVWSLCTLCEGDVLIVFGTNWHSSSLIPI